MIEFKNLSLRGTFLRLLVISLTEIALITGLVSAADSSLPRLEAQGAATRLIVDGKPFLILGGGLGNSTGEPEYAERLLTKSFGTLKQPSPLLTENVGRGTMAGLLPPAAERHQPHQFRLGDYVLNLTYERAVPSSLADGVIVPDSASARGALLPGGLVIALGADEYLFAGMGVIVTFDLTRPGEQVGILNVQEGRFVNGEWKPTRWLNGD